MDFVSDDIVDDDVDLTVVLADSVDVSDIAVS